MNTTEGSRVDTFVSQFYGRTGKKSFVTPVAEVNKYKKASQSVKTALRGIEFIAQHIKNADKDNEVTLLLYIYRALWPLL